MGGVISSCVILEYCHTILLIMAMYFLKLKGKGKDAQIVWLEFI